MLNMIIALLQVVFITCKIVGVAPIAAWSWVWVMAPLWMSIAIPLAIAILIWIAIGLMAWGHEKKTLKFKAKRQWKL